MMLKKSLVLTFFVLAVLSSGNGVAQEQEKKTAPIPPYSQPQEKPEKPELGLVEGLPALEAPVDPHTYIVGPGDKFYINIPGYLQEGFQTIVTAEGKLIVPTVGTFQVSGKTLAQVQHEVEEAGRKKYLQTRISANLINLRMFRIHVLGEVWAPGIYPIRPTYRLTDALELAQGTSDWADLSAVEIRHQDHSTTRVNLSDYLQHGDLQSNPTIRNGDVVLVPRVSENMIRVRIEGRIDKPGIYFARPDETPEAFLLRIKGIRRKSDWRSAVIRRPDSEGKGFRLIPLFADSGLADSAHDRLATMPALQSGDIISIPSVTDSVYVQGAVWRPGAFPFYPGFHARDYAGLAGPNEKSAGMQGIRLRHARTGKIERGPDKPVEPGDTIEVSTATRLVFKDYMSIVGTLISAILTVVTVRELLRR